MKAAVASATAAFCVTSWIKRGFFEVKMCKVSKILAPLYRKEWGVEIFGRFTVVWRKHKM